MPLRMSGLSSGLDTESLIAELVKAKSVKKETYVKKQKSITYKQDAWKSLNTKLVNLYSKTVNSLKYVSSYSQKKTSVSNTSAASVITGEGAVNGVQSLQISSLAKSGYLTGAQMSKNGAYSSSTKLSEIAGFNISDGESISFDVTTNGTTTSINLNGSSSISDVVSQLRNTGLNASFDEKNQRLFVSSSKTGADSDFSITANGESGFKALSALGINVQDSASVAQYTTLANMTDAEVADMIDSQVTARANALQTQLDTINEDLDKLDEGITKFLTNNGYADNDAVDTAYDALTAQKDALSVVPDDETDEDKEIRENSLKEVESKLKGIDEHRVNVNNQSILSTEQSNIEGQLANNNQAIKDAVTAEVTSKVDYAKQVVNGTVSGYSTGATRVEGKNAAITLNGATFESSSNTFEINGLTITALSETAAGESVTLTTADDYDAIYDTLKKFINEYNTLINEMDKQYNAESAKGYEPLTDDEKEAMSDSEVAAWETKLKDSALRRDSTLSTVSNMLRGIMSSGYEVNGKTMYLSDFGIEKLNYFVAADNERNAYHIDGDPDNANTSGNADKLKSMIASDPSTVISFFTQLTRNMYESVYAKMKSNDYSSYNSIYDDKLMKEDYNRYTTKISEQEKKITALENRYYKQFTAMEVALSKMESSQNAITSLLGG